MKKFRKWQVVYAVCCLVYLGWMINRGANEFDKINGQYRRLVDGLDAGRIRTAALEELMADCRRELTKRSDRREDACFSPPPTVVEARSKKIEERLIRAKERGTVKLVLFYTGFVLFFLLGPPLFIYLLIFGIIKVFSIIKIVR